MKRLLSASAAIFLIAVLVTGCTPGQEPSVVEHAGTDGDREAIEAVVQQELSAFSAGDVEAFVSILTEDVVFDPTSQPAVVGIDAVRSWCEEAFKRFELEASYAVDELVVDGDWAFDRGVWNEKMTPKDGGETIEAPFGILQVYRRQSDGSWKLARSIWNTEGPPGETAAGDTT